MNNSDQQQKKRKLDTSNDDTRVWEHPFDKIVAAPLVFPKIDLSFTGHTIEFSCDMCKQSDIDPVITAFDHLQHHLCYTCYNRERRKIYSRRVEAGDKKERQRLMKKFQAAHKAQVDALRDLSDAELQLYDLYLTSEGINDESS